MSTQLTNQQIFDRVAEHLLRQACKSVRGGGNDSGVDQECAYRGADGRRCAIGCLIPDELYNGSIEGTAVGDLWPPLLRECGLQIGEKTGLLQELQELHDLRQVRDWPEELQHISCKYSGRGRGLGIRRVTARHLIQRYGRDGSWGR